MMKYKVNLYSAEFQPKLRLITLPLVCSAWLMSLVIFGAWYVFALNQQQQLDTQLAELEQNKKQQAQVLRSLQTELANVGKDPRLQAELDQQARALQARQAVLAQLQGMEDLKARGFASLMLELAEQHQVGLWLTHIQLDGKQVVLEGATNESALVPRWLAGLSKTAYFQGQEFTQTQLYRDPDQVLNFVISSSPDHEPGAVASGGRQHE